MIGISAPAVPGMGEAIKQSGRSDVKVLGLSLPNLCKPYVHDGYIQAVVYGIPGNLGYLAVAAPAALVRKQFERVKPYCRFQDWELSPFRERHHSRQTSHIPKGQH